MMRKTLCVIGASGLVGSHIVKAALGKGYRVNGTMRNLNDLESTSYLKKLKNPGQYLEIQRNQKLFFFFLQSVE